MNNPMHIHQVTITIHAEANDYLPHVRPGIEWGIENPTRQLLIVHDETEQSFEHSITSVLADDDTCTSEVTAEFTLCIETHLNEAMLSEFLKENLYVHLEDLGGWITSYSFSWDVQSGII